MRQYQDAKQLFSSSKNFRALRELIGVASPPTVGLWRNCFLLFLFIFLFLYSFIPKIVYSGVALRDLIYIHDSMETFVGPDASSVNLSKVFKILKLI